jgi:HK97 gp10 family phage protein
MSSVDGLGNLQRALQALGDGASAALGKAVLAGGFALEGKIKESMGEQKSGRMYGKHQASAPGEAPAIDTGALLNSINTELTAATPTKAEGQVATNQVYAPPLEFGTSRMAARPFMRPAADKHQDKVAEATQAALAKAIKEASHAGS